MLLPLPDRFEAPRLLVRPVEERDLPALLAVNGDAQTVSFLPYPQWGSLADGQAWLQRMRTLEAGGTARQYVAALRAGDEAVGSVLIFRMEAALARAEVQQTRQVGLVDADDVHGAQIQPAPDLAGLGIALEQHLAPG